MDEFSAKDDRNFSNNVMVAGLGQQLMARFSFQNGGRCRDRRGCTGSENILKKLLIIFKVALI